MAVADSRLHRLDRSDAVLLHPQRKCLKELGAQAAERGDAVLHAILVSSQNVHGVEAQIATPTLHLVRVGPTAEIAPVVRNGKRPPTEAASAKVLFRFLRNRDSAARSYGCNLNYYFAVLRPCKMGRLCGLSKQGAHRIRRKLAFVPLFSKSEVQRAG